MQSPPLLVFTPGAPQASVSNHHRIGNHGVGRERDAFITDTVVSGCSCPAAQSRLTLVTPRIVVCQAPLPRDFSRQEY